MSNNELVGGFVAYINCKLLQTVVHTVLQFPPPTIFGLLVTEEAFMALFFTTCRALINTTLIAETVNLIVIIFN